MTNAERFLNAYSAIEHELQRLLDLKEHRRFYDLVNMAAKLNPVVEHYKFDLKEYADLRNAIVHDRADGQIIAEPNEAAVESIEGIARLLLEPPGVIPLFEKEVLLLSVNEPVSRAIRDMGKYSFSQVPVTENDIVTGLLTSQMLVLWMGKKLAEGSLNLDRATVGDVMSSVGYAENFGVVPADTSLFAVLELFYQFQAKGSKLEAVLITHHGTSGEPLLGIITNRDLPLLQRELVQAGRPRG